MALRFNTIYLFIVAALLFVATATEAHAKKEYTKNYNKEFDITADGKVHLVNRKGDINIETWNQNKVKIEVLITVKTGSESKAEETFERINIEFTNSDDFVEAITSIEDKSWWNVSVGYAEEYRIDYKVHLPKSNQLEIENKYGDIFIPDMDGAVDVTTKYGDFHAGTINNDMNLVLGYGNAIIGNAQDFNATIKYSKLRLENAELLELETKYSKVFIGNAREIKCTTKYDNYDIGTVEEFRNQGKYDDFEIEEVGRVVATAKYTDFKLNKLHDNAEMDLNYGGAKIASISKGFSNVNLIGNYTDYKIYVADDTNYVLDVETDYAGVKYPEAMNVTYEEKESHSRELQGYVGNKNAKGAIKVRLKYGGIKVERP